MDLLHIALWGVLVFTTLGLFFGIALASAARKFHVPVNPQVEEVRENLPEPPSYSAVRTLLRVL